MLSSSLFLSSSLMHRVASNPAAGARAGPGPWNMPGLKGSSYWATKGPYWTLLGDVGGMLGISWGLIDGFLMLI